ncbi:MAG: FHA domain-containing protein [Deltaproteobacteria bacterium]|nr:FHA domain-containing protein [Deltaproteobacteria bacterium]MBW2135925.1 FHA domain-containing protein [Deltaproteobacteria bacterium]
MAVIQVMTGPKRGEHHSLEGDVTFIGRSPDNNIVIDDSAVSRSHVRITRKGKKYFIRDLNSKNGTFVNGERIEPNKDVEIDIGASIGISKKVIVSLVDSYEQEDLGEEELEVLDAVSLPEEMEQEGKVLVQDRPMTHKKNMELISKVAAILEQSLNLNQTLESILQSILDLLIRIDRGFFILVDKQTGKISNIISIFSKQREHKVGRFSRSIVGRVIKEKKPVIMLDTLSEDEHDVSESMQLMNIRSVMCVPLMSRSRLRGVLYFDSIQRPHGFRKEDLSLITALSGPAAIAIENALLSDRKEES